MPRQLSSDYQPKRPIGLLFAARKHLALQEARQVDHPRLRFLAEDGGDKGEGRFLG
jgi:hypothetical protein